MRESRVDVLLASPHGNPMGCANTTELIIVSGEFDNSKAMVAAVLAAHLSGKRISGWIQSCLDGRRKLSAVNVEK